MQFFFPPKATSDKDTIQIKVHWWNSAMTTRLFFFSETVITVHDDFME